MSCYALIVQDSVTIYVSMTEPLAQVEDYDSMA